MINLTSLSKKSEPPQDFMVGKRSVPHTKWNSQSVYFVISYWMRSAVGIIAPFSTSMSSVLTG